MWQMHASAVAHLLLRNSCIVATPHQAVHIPAEESHSNAASGESFTAAKSGMREAGGVQLLLATAATLPRV
jgi:hypothetical protein